MGMIMKDGIPYGGIYPIDDAPTQGSNNAVKSGGVFSSLSNKVDKVAGKGLSTNDYDDTEKGKVADNASAIEAMVNQYGSKNLAPNNASTTEMSPVTFTVNSDKSVSVARTGNHSSWRTLVLSKNITLKAGTYILSSGYTGDEQYTVYFELVDSTGSVAKTDLSDAVTFTIQTDITNGMFQIAVRPGNSTFNVTIKPMLRDARVADSTYVPYAMTNRELTNRVLNPSYSNEVLLVTMSDTDNVIAVTATVTGWIIVSAPLSGSGDRTIKGYITDESPLIKFGTGLYAFIPNYNGGSVGCLPCVAGHSYKIVAYGHDSVGLEIYQYKLS